MLRRSSLVIAPLFGLTLASIASAAVPSSAIAARPSLPASKIGAPLELLAARDLESVLTGKLGLETESPAVRDGAIALAKRYAAFRRKPDTPANRQAFAAECEKTLQNPHCAAESARLAALAPPVAAAPKDANKKPFDRAATQSELENAQFTALALRPLGHLAAAVSAYGSFDAMSKALSALKTDTSCASGDAAMAVASRAEEFFPDQAAIDAALDLYERAGRCLSPTTAVRAQYRLGLIAVWQGRCDSAESAMQSIEASPAGYSLRSRARYWRLHCARQRGSTELAEGLRQSLIKDHPLSFHNLAINGANPEFLAALSTREAPRVAMRSAIRPEANVFIRSLEALITIGAGELAGEAVDLSAGQIASLEPEIRLYVAVLLNRGEQGLSKFRLMSQLFQEKPNWISPGTLRLFYPLWYADEMKKSAGEVDPLLLISLTRQESGFNSNAKSSAGARGLMQVMPATARAIASVGRSKLFDPLINIAVGAKFFRKSLDRFSGDVELTLAGYNAGPERAARWSKRYPVQNRILFIDLIPFRETRDYVSSILRNYYWYVQLYGPQAPLRRPAQATSLPAKAAPWPTQKTLAILAASAGSGGN